MLDRKYLSRTISSGRELYLAPLYHDKSYSPSIMLAEADALKDLQAPHVHAYFNNDPIICAPKNPVIGLAIDRATQLILDDQRQGKMSDIHGVTGTGNITAAISYYMNYNQNVSFVPLIGWDAVAQIKLDLKYKLGDRKLALRRSCSLRRMNHPHAASETDYCPNK